MTQREFFILKDMLRRIDEKNYYRADSIMTEITVLRAMISVLSEKILDQKEFHLMIETVKGFEDDLKKGLNDRHEEKKHDDEMIKWLKNKLSTPDEDIDTLYKK